MTNAERLLIEAVLTSQPEDELERRVGAVMLERITPELREAVIRAELRCLEELTARQELWDVLNKLGVTGHRGAHVFREIQEEAKRRYEERER